MVGPRGLSVLPAWGTRSFVRALRARRRPTAWGSSAGPDGGSCLSGRSLISPRKLLQNHSPRNLRYEKPKRSYVRGCWHSFCQRQLGFFLHRAGLEPVCSPQGQVQDRLSRAPSIGIVCRRSMVAFDGPLAVDSQAADTFPGRRGWAYLRERCSGRFWPRRTPPRPDAGYCFSHSRIRLLPRLSQMRPCRIPPFSGHGCLP